MCFKYLRISILNKQFCGYEFILFHCESIYLKHIFVNGYYPFIICLYFCLFVHSWFKGVRLSVFICGNAYLIYLFVYQVCEPGVLITFGSSSRPCGSIYIWRVKLEVIGLNRVCAFCLKLVAERLFQFQVQLVL